MYRGIRKKGRKNQNMIRQFSEEELNGKCDRRTDKVQHP